jgi:hypothetical protein
LTAYRGRDKISEISRRVRNLPEGSAKILEGIGDPEGRGLFREEMGKLLKDAESSEGQAASGEW